jgi:molecular chaperone DnaJ
MKRDYYEVLNVQRNAPESEIKKSFRKLAQTCHPDKNQGDPDSEEAFKELNEAYEVLMDPERRANYDRYGHNQPQAGGFNPFEHFGGMGFNPFGDFFNGDIFGGRGGGRQVNTRGEDLQCVINLTLEEVYSGCDKELTYTRHKSCSSCNSTGGANGAPLDNCGTCNGQGRVTVIHGPFHMAQPCPMCRGEGKVIRTPCSVCKGEGRVAEPHTVRVSIPISIEDNTHLKVTGSGSAGRRGGPSGDLICLIKVKEHAKFKRSGVNLLCETGIPFVLAALGGEIPLEGIDGVYSVTVPPGTQSETTLRLPGRGLMTPNGRGDVLMRVRVTVPHSLTDEQKQALLVFANL